MCEYTTHMVKDCGNTVVSLTKLALNKGALAQDSKTTKRERSMCWCEKNCVEGNSHSHYKCTRAQMQESARATSLARGAIS